MAKKVNPGLPKPESVVEVKELVSPKGAKYQILRTNEKDATDVKSAKKKQP